MSARSDVDSNAIRGLSLVRRGFAGRASFGGRPVAPDSRLGVLHRRLTGLRWLLMLLLEVLVRRQRLLEVLMQLLLLLRVDVLGMGEGLLLL